MSSLRHSLFAALAVLGVSMASTAGAEERTWTVSRSSGEVWIATPGAQQVALSSDVKPGDTLRTGRNGRVLLVRGEESILVSPNSSISVPKDAGEGMSTTILQQAGSILLEVEKRNVKHFEVQTPSLAAVVKGTQFRISIGATGTSVNVTRGQVEVAHYKTGQIAQIMPGQTATAFAHGKVGLSLSGSGTFSPIEKGTPRSSPVERLVVPKGGLTPVRQASGSGMQVRAIAQTKTGVSTSPVQKTKVALHGPVRGGIRISAPLGDVRLNFSKVTHGLARSAGPVVGGSSRSTASSETTIWSSDSSTARATSSSASTTSAAAVTAAASVSATPVTNSSNDPGTPDISGKPSNPKDPNKPGKVDKPDKPDKPGKSDTSDKTKPEGNRGDHGGHGPNNGDKNARGGNSGNANNGIGGIGNGKGNGKS